MPFSPSHVAAVLPLARRPLVTSALVIGSVLPDLPYYLPLPISGQISHSLAGAVLVDPPLGAAVLAAYHGLAAALAAYALGWHLLRLARNGLARNGKDTTR